MTGLLSRLIRPYTEKTVAVVCFFGFVSGLCLLLSGNTLNFWLATEKINIDTVGLFSLVALPYTCKYFLAPLVEHVDIPLLTKRFGRRRSWILCSQIFLIMSVIMLANVDDVKGDLGSVAVFSFLIALFSVLQDIALDAYRIELLVRKNKGAGSSMFIIGYRLGMLTSGAGFIYLSSFISWQKVYYVAAFILLLVMVLISQIKQEFGQRDNTGSNLQKMSFQGCIKATFAIAEPKMILPVCLFVLLYNFTDNFSGAMMNPFLLNMGFNETEIALGGKLFGITASVIGGIIGGALISEVGIYSCLFWFGLAHILSYSLSIAQADIGYNTTLFYYSVLLQKFSGGMSMAVYMTYITDLCKGNQLAVQYAFLSSLMGVSRALLPTMSGMVVDYLGWPKFFACTMIVGLLPLAIIKIIQIKPRHTLP
jgi:PAT family beta-lactamase induction signal transducer AmpG